MGASRSVRRAAVCAVSCALATGARVVSAMRVAKSVATGGRGRAAQRVMGLSLGLIGAPTYDWRHAVGKTCPDKWYPTMAYLAASRSRQYDCRVCEAPVPSGRRTRPRPAGETTRVAPRFISSVPLDPIPSWRMQMTRTPIRPSARHVPSAPVTTRRWSHRLAAFGLALLFGVAPRAAQAQTGTISGSVVDQGSQRALPNVQVVVQGQAGRGAVTDANGHFRIAGLAAGTVTLEARLIGYSPVTR